jgi:hypothetical protein
MGQPSVEPLPTQYTVPASTQPTMMPSQRQLPTIPTVVQMPMPVITAYQPHQAPVFGASEVTMVSGGRGNRLGQSVI